jgi:hypothetical protein
MLRSILERVVSCVRYPLWKLTSAVAARAAGSAEVAGVPGVGRPGARTVAAPVLVIDLLVSAAAGGVGVRGWRGGRAGGSVSLLAIPAAVLEARFGVQELQKADRQLQIGAFVPVYRVGPPVRLLPLNVG